jgi:hypothetical protein
LAFNNLLESSFIFAAITMSVFLDTDDVILDP